MPEATLSVQAFCESVRDARLLDAPEQKELATLAGRGGDVRAVAREAMQRGWLTPYQVNQLIAGNGRGLVLDAYVLLERLGAGGMGQVFKARHRKLGRLAAVKIVHPRLLDTAEAVRRFHKEIRAVAQLAHPNVVRAYDAGQVGETHFFAMEYVEGTDLQQLVKRSGPLPVLEACDVVRQAAWGLQHAHGRGLVHRDIKPSNLLVGRDGVVKLLDLGLARLHPSQAEDASSTSLTTEGAVMGTLDYLAPEQAKDAHRVDIRADLYSLGCTLYFLLAGRPPFAGCGRMEKLFKHQWEEPAPLRQLRPEVPPAVVAVVSKLTAKRPEDRYQTPADVALALEDLVQGGSTTTVGAAAGAEGETEAAGVPPTAPPPGLPAALGPGDSTRTWQEPAAVEQALVKVATLIGVPALLKEPPPAELRRRRLARLTVGAAALVFLSATVVGWQFSGGGRDAEAPPQADPRIAPPAAVKVMPYAKLQELGRRFRDPFVDRAQLWDDLVAFRAEHPTADEAHSAADLMIRLPSPLDRLSHDAVPDDEREAPEYRQAIVQVLGDNRLRGGAWAIAASPDGKYVATAGGDSAVVQLWDAATMRRLRTLRNSHRGSDALAFSPDGKRLLSGDLAGRLKLWDPATGEEVLALQGHGRLTCAAFLPDGDHFVCGTATGKHGVFVYRLGERKLVVEFRGDGKPVRALAVSRDGKYVLSGGDGPAVFLWEAATGDVIAELPGHGGGAWGVAFDPRDDGRTLITLSADGQLRFRDPGNKAVLRTFREAKAGSCLAASPDGSRLLVGGGRDVLCFDALTGQSVRLRHHDAVQSVAFLSGGREALSGGEYHSLRRWDLAEPGQEAEVEPRGPLAYATGSPCFLPDGAHLLCCMRRADSDDGFVGLYDVRTRELVRTFQARHAGVLQSLAVTTDGEWLAAGGGQNEGLVYVWRLREPRGAPAQVASAGKGAVRCVTIPPGRRTVISAGADGTVREWDLATGRELRRFEGHTPPVHALAVSPDGKLLISGGGSEADVARREPAVRAWDLDTGKLVPTRLPAPAEPVHGIAFAARGAQVVLGSRRRSTGAALISDGVVRLCDLKGAREPVVVNHYWMSRVAVSPDGRDVVLGGETGEVTRRRLETGAEKTWPLPERIKDVAYAPDGRHVAAVAGSGVAYILRVAPADEVARD